MGTITVSTTIPANINKVWECWTSVQHIIHWNFANSDWCCPKADNNLTPKGKFSYRMESKDGSIGFDFEGEYQEVILHELITYQMADGRSVRIKFVPQGNEVQILETFDAEGTNADEQQRAGWQAILENFKQYVVSQS